MGATSSALGFPASDVLVIPGGYVSCFAGQFCASGGPDGSGSAIYYSSATGGHEVQGCIYDAYQKAGGQTGRLGYPVTDEYTTGSGNKESDFQGGYIVWANGQAYVYFYNCLPCS